MQNQIIMALGCALVSTASVGCGWQSPPGLGSPDRLTLYSIAGGSLAPGTGPKTDEEFHGYRVLGKAEVADPDSRKEIVTALRTGLDRADRIAMCFHPRHAIRTEESGRTVDYLICFECDRLEVREGDAKSFKPVTRDPQTVLDKHLKAAGIQ